jgi:hypothetical protein
MNGKTINNVETEVMKMFSGVRGQLQKAQSTPIGTTERTKRERTNIWNAIMGLDKETSNAIMQEMAAMAGHKGGAELDGCDFCKFVMENIGK